MGMGSWRTWARAALASAALGATVVATSALPAAAGNDPKLGGGTGGGSKPPSTTTTTPPTTTGPPVAPGCSSKDADPGPVAFFVVLPKAASTTPTTDPGGTSSDEPSSDDSGGGGKQAEPDADTKARMEAVGALSAKALQADPDGKGLEAKDTVTASIGPNPTQQEVVAALDADAKGRLSRGEVAVALSDQAQSGLDLSSGVVLMKPYGEGIAGRLASELANLPKVPAKGQLRLTPEAKGSATAPATYTLDLEGRPSGRRVAIGHIAVNTGNDFRAECNGGYPLTLPATLTLASRQVNAGPPAITDVFVTPDAVDLPELHWTPSSSAGGDDPGDTTPNKPGDAADPKDTGDDSSLPIGPMAVVGVVGVGLGYAASRRGSGKGGAAVPAGYPAGSFPAGAVVPAEPPAPTHPPRHLEEPAVPHQPPPPPAPGWTAAIPGGAVVRYADLGLMRLTASATASGLAWSHTTDRWLLGAGWSEKVAGKGEDAEPVVRMHASGRGLLAVFDGTGGAGSASARRLPDGGDLSGAYVASRLSKQVTEAWFTEQVDRGVAVEGAALATRLSDALRDETTYPDVPRSTMKGSLQRVLPTTLAAVAVAVGPDAVDVDALWAGDSRCYALTPTHGLQVLSVDDTRETDALALIRNDQPMTNLVCGDRPFTVNQLRFRFNQPLVVLTATDGCFGYVRTPAHFEYLLLDSLVQAPDLASWSAELVEAMAAIAADDTSFSFGAYGFRDFAELQDLLRPRRDHLAEVHWAPFQQAAGDPEAIEALRNSSWHDYRDLYHERVLREPAT
jgi:hypothetical protein